MERVSVNVQNNTHLVLTLPNNAKLPAGGVVRVQDWQFLENDDGVQAWIRAGAIEVVDDHKMKEAPTREHPRPRAQTVDGQPESESPTGPAKLLMTDEEIATRDDVKTTERRRKG